LVRQYAVEYRRISDNIWRSAGNTSIPTIVISNLEDDAYIIRVATIDIYGRRSPWSESLPDSSIVNWNFLFDISSNSLALAAI
jgi:hypothetical protein